MRLQASPGGFPSTYAALGILVVWLQAMTAVCALRLINVDVPSPTTKGETVGLNCNYELGGDRLYSVKWYKNDIEFYRYVPNDWPPGQFLPLPGVDVDLSGSGRGQVFLKSVNLHSAGTYRCEVSAEAPSFDTVEGQRDMIVYVLPTEGPRITGSINEYHVGDTVSVNCTSAKSKPASTLQWYINGGEPVGPEYETEYSTTLHSDGLETSTLALRFVATEKHFRNGTMKLRCTSTISRVYTMIDEELVSGGKLKNSDLKIEISSRVSGINTLNNTPVRWLQVLASLLVLWISLLTSTA